MIAGESRDDIKTQVKEQADIVQIIGECVELKRSGTRFLGLCPFHGEKTPSFSVHSGQQFFHCFGCGESGDVFSFMMKYYSLDFPEALKNLAGRYNIVLPEKRLSHQEQLLTKKRQALYAVNEKAAEIFHHYLNEAQSAAPARRYLQKRGVSETIIADFRLGYAPSVDDEGWNYLAAKLSRDELATAIEAGLLVAKERGGSYDRFRDRIVFPLADLSGRICGFGGRIVGEGQPKYLNSPESAVFNKSKLLLGLYQQKEHIRRKNSAILVEGNFDLISLVAGGCMNVVAPLGTALTREQLRLIKRFAEGATLLFDGDTAGVKAAARAVPLFLAEQVSGSIALLPKGHDPDTYIREKGLQALNVLVDEAASLPEFVVDRWVEDFGLTLDGKRRIVEELRPLIKAAVSPLQRSVFVAHFAEKLGMSVDQLDGFLSGPVNIEAPQPVVPPKKKKPQAVAPLSFNQRQVVEFMILHPESLELLEQHGIRECLLGSVGEIIFLQFKHLLAGRPEAEPEELLTLLPEGEERRLVAGLLFNAPRHRENPIETDESGREIDDQLEYLDKFCLKKEAEQLMERMQQAQQAGDVKLVEKLMIERMVVIQKLHG